MVSISFLALTMGMGHFIPRTSSFLRAMAVSPWTWRASGPTAAILPRRRFLRRRRALVLAELPLRDLLLGGGLRAYIILDDLGVGLGRVLDRSPHRFREHLRRPD